MKIRFLGATGTVTGSRYLVGERSPVLIDCGLFQGYKQLRLRNWAPPPFDPAAVRAVILTHAHIDHSGYLPVLAKRGFRGPIYCSGATDALCRILLPDSAHLQEEEAQNAPTSPIARSTRVARPRVLVYSAILVAIVGAAGANLWMRVPIKMDVIRDRGSVAREVADDRIENVYRLQVMNTDEWPHRFTLGVEGSEHLRHLELLSDRQPMEIGAVASEPIAVRVRAEPRDADGAQKIEFVLRTVDRDGSRPVVVHEKSRFLVPSSLARKDSHDEH